jgi:hypothetical protein
MREMTGLPPVKDQENALRSAGLAFEKNAPIYIDRKPRPETEVRRQRQNQSS